MGYQEEKEKKKRKKRRASASQRKGRNKRQRTSKRAPESEEEDKSPSPVYEVERVISQRITVNTEYLIRWRGFSSQEDTWEPEDALKSCQKKLRDFKKICQKQS